jgi:hypothetical protein
MSDGHYEIAEFMLINMGREGIKQTANNILMTYIPLGSL